MIIAVASPSQTSNDEWKKYLAKKNRRFNPPPEVYKDYALMKVLSQLRQYNSSSPIPIQTFKWEANFTRLNFTALQKDDLICIVGHGNQYGLKAIGVCGEDETDYNRKNTDHLLKILTADGSLQKKSKSFPVKILLLSCRSGLGLHVVMARKLSKLFSKDVIVGGSVGFTFGSPRTLSKARTEVLIEGIPWLIDYPGSIDKKKAESSTSNREGKSLTYEGKRKEIEAFIKAKSKIESDLMTIVGKLKQTEVNKALDELYAKQKKDWMDQLTAQFDLYFNAKIASNLEFDMWFDNPDGGYVWEPQGTLVKDQEVDAHLRKHNDAVPDLQTTIR